MKRLLSILLSSVMLAGLVVLPISAAESTAQIIVEENFDGDSVQTGVLPSFNTAAMPDGADGKCANLQNDANQVITLPKKVTSGVLVLEFDIYPTSEWNSTKSFILYGNSNKMNFTAMINNGYLRNSKWNNVKQLALDTWHNIRLIIDCDSGKYYMQADGEAVPNMVEDAFADTIKAGMEKFMIYSPPLIYMDNIKLYTDSGTNTFGTSPSNKAVDVNTGADIKISFNTAMDKSTLTAEGIKLVNERTGESVDYTIKSVSDVSVVLKPKKALENYTRYKIVLGENVLTADGLKPAYDSVSFRTKQMDIKEEISVEESSWENGKSTVKLKNTSSSDKEAAVITAVFENSDGQPQRMTAYCTKTDTVPGGGTVEIESDSLEVSDECTAVVFIWDSLEGKNVLAPAVVFGEAIVETAENGSGSAGIALSKKDVNVNSGTVNLDAMSNRGDGIRVACTVENPNGKLCWIGQPMTKGEGGVFGIDFRLGEGVVNGTYTVKMRADGDSSVTTDTFEVDTTHSLPAAVNVKVGGEPIVGRTATGEYGYFHIGNAEESGTEYQWYVADSAQGTPEPIDGATGREFTIDEKYSGKYLFFEVTPKTAAATGEPERSGATPVLTPPSAKNVRIEGKVRVGETVSAAYTYYHISSAAEGESKISWLYSQNGTDWTEIGEKSELYIGDGYEGGYIKVEVTPVATVYPEEGITVSSEASTVLKRVSQNASVGDTVSGGSTSVILPPASTPATSAAFTDIDGHWSQGSVEKLAKDKIISGYADGSFKPGANISRAEFVTLIVKALGLSGAEAQFDDVGAQDWFAEAVGAVAANGIVVGDGTLFRPQDNITREEIAVVMIKAYIHKYGGEIADGASSFKDADKISAWAQEYVNKAVSLGIMSGDDDGSFRPGDYATRAEAAAVIYRLLNLKITGDKEESAGKLDVLQKLGIFDGKADTSATVGDLAAFMDTLSVHYDAQGREAEPLLWDEALEQCLVALNYTAILEHSGKAFATLVRLARSEDMLAGLSCEQGEEISTADFSELIYNTLCCHPVDQSFASDEISLKKIDETLLKQKFGISAREGIVTGVPSSRLYSNDGNSRGYVEIDGTMYSYAEADINDLLGYPVRVYCKDDSDKALYIEKQEKDYRTKVINWSEIKDISGGSIVYEVDGSRKRQAVDSEAVVLENNVFKGFFDSVSKSVLSPERGEIVLIDNDDDGKYEVVSVTKYDVRVVDSVNVGSEMIVFKNEAGYISFDEDRENNEITYSIIRNGEEYPISELQEWDVLIVKSAVNKSGDAFHNIRVVRRSMKGVLTGYDEEHIWVDNVEYVLSPSLDLSSLELGNYYEFMFGGNDELAAVCNDIKKSYGYLVYAKYIATDETGYIKLCTSSNEKKIVELVEEASLNGAKKTNEEICAALSEHQLIAYSENSEGKITGIYTAKDNTATGDTIDDFSLDAAKANRKYYKQQFGGFYQMASDGTAFFVATVAAGEEFTEKHVKVGTTEAYQSSNGVDCEFYDVDELGNAGAAIFFDFSNGEIPAKTVPVIVVDKIREGINDDGDVGYTMTFYENGVHKSLFLADDVSKAPTLDFPYENYDKIDSVLDLGTGDVIEYATDVDGNLSVYRPVFLRSQKNTLGGYSQNESGIQPLYDACYNVVDYAKDGNFVMRYGNDKRRYSSVASTSVIKYDSATDTLSVATKDDILGKNQVGAEDASKAFALRMWTALKLVVIYD